MFEHAAAKAPCIRCGAAGDEVDPWKFRQFFRYFLDIRALRNRIFYRLRLLVDLLYHEVLEAALFRLRHTPVYRLGFFIHHPPGVYFFYHNLLLPDNPVLAVVKDYDLFCQRKECRNVGCDKIFAVSNTDNKRAFMPCYEYIVFFVRQHRHGETATEFFYRRDERRLRAATVLVFLFYEVRYDLGIGFRKKFVAPFHKAGPETLEVLDYPVVDYCDFPIAVLVRVGVFPGRRPVGRPSGVRNRNL